MDRWRCIDPAHEANGEGCCESCTPPPMQGQAFELGRDGRNELILLLGRDPGARAAAGRGEVAAALEAAAAAATSPGEEAKLVEMAGKLRDERTAAPAAYKALDNEGLALAARTLRLASDAWRDGQAPGLVRRPISGEGRGGEPAYQCFDPAHEANGEGCCESCTPPPMQGQAFVLGRDGRSLLARLLGQDPGARAAAGRGEVAAALEAKAAEAATSPGEAAKLVKKAGKLRDKRTAASKAYRALDKEGLALAARTLRLASDAWRATPP